MRKVRVGYSRLYNAAGCKVVDNKEVNIRITLDGVQVRASIGRGFKHVVLQMPVAAPVPKDDIGTLPPTRRRSYEVPSPEVFPADLYVEILASKEIELDEKLAAAFFKKEPAAKSEVIRRAALEEKTFNSALDYVAGSLGLRMHHTLVALPIQDHCFAYRGKGDSYVVSVKIHLTTTDAFELKVVERGGSSSQKLLPPLQSPKDWKRAADTLGWLLRAWASKDSVLTFVSLFTALESVIPGVPGKSRGDIGKNRVDVLKLINEHAPKKDCERLGNYVKGLRGPSASLNERFEYWSKKVGLKGWAKDIVAFKKFSRMRNLMFHTGEPGVEIRITVDDEDVRSLADVAERYVSFELFGDADAYQSSIRPFQRNQESVIQLTMSILNDARQDETSSPAVARLSRRTR